MSVDLGHYGSIALIRTVAARLPGQRWAMEAEQRVFQLGRILDSVGGLRGQALGTWTATLTGYHRWFLARARESYLFGFQTIGDALLIIASRIGRAITLLGKGAGDAWREFLGLGADWSPMDLLKVATDEKHRSEWFLFGALVLAGAGGLFLLTTPGFQTAVAAYALGTSRAVPILAAGTARSGIELAAGGRALATGGGRFVGNLTASGLSTLMLGAP